MPSTSPHEALLADEFPILDQGLYFNHASVGPWPRVTARAVQGFAEENMRQGSVAYGQWYARETELRRMLARMLGADSEDSIALLKNTTEGICTVAFGLDWRTGDNMVLPVGEFPSNRLPWVAQAERGVELREVDIRHCRNAEDALLDAMDGNTRLLSVSAVQWNDGFRLDLAVLGAACRERGVLFFVDAIQQLGALPMDAGACHIDFLAADAHKWLLAPEGIAVFYCSEAARPRLRLLQQGWHMYDDPFNFERDDWTPSANSRRFEAGTPNSVGQAALHASVGLLLDYGMERVSERVLANTEFLLEALGATRGIRIHSDMSPARRSGIVSFSHGELQTRNLKLALDRAGVGTGMRGQAIRLSPHFYQGEKQLRQFMDILESQLR